MLNSEITHAYIDERGNFGYDFTKKGTSNYFLVCAVLVEPEYVSPLVNAVQEGIQRGGELKSNRIGKDHIKRFKTLQALLKVPFHVIYVVLDKRKIYPDTGLTWKKSFFKYSHKCLYIALSKSFESLRITADEYGDTEFMEGFEKYVENNCGLLFKKYTFRFDKSKNNKLLQLADFIAGTLYLGYINEVPKHYEPYLKLLKNKILDYDVFPGDYKNYLVEVDTSASSLDKEIADHSIRLADQYIKKHNNSQNTWEICRVLVLKRLLYELRINPTGYLATKGLRNLVSYYMKYEGSLQEFRAEVFGKLRDKGVSIVSSDKGLKLPISLNEIYIHCNRTIQIINPMLARLQALRKNIRIATKNELDILDEPQYIELKQYLDLLNKTKEQLLLL